MFMLPGGLFRTVHSIKICANNLTVVGKTYISKKWDFDTPKMEESLNSDEKVDEERMKKEWVKTNKIPSHLFFCT